MNSVVRQVKKERTVGVSRDEAGCFASKRVGQILAFFNRLAATVNRIIGFIVGLVVPHVRRINQPLIRAHPATSRISGKCLASQHG